MLDSIVASANRIHCTRYGGAVVTFLAGSLIRGESTATSDLDLVVVFARVPQAYRESFRFDGWPVEAFVHDAETLGYFFLEADRPTGIPSLACMVSEGIEIPGPSDSSRSLKELADSTLRQGPSSWGRAEIDASRYAITSLIDDLRQPRSRAEAIATATTLYRSLADHYFRSRQVWSAKDKSIPRKLREADAALAERFESGFDKLFRSEESVQVIALAEEVLAPNGGWLFDNYVASAPDHWRRPLA